MSTMTALYCDHGGLVSHNFFQNICHNFYLRNNVSIVGRALSSLSLQSVVLKKSLKKQSNAINFHNPGSQLAGIFDVIQSQKINPKEQRIRELQITQVYSAFAVLDIKSVLDIFALTIHDTVNAYVRLALVYF